MTTKLYVCMGGDGDGDWITAIFDTQEQADEHLLSASNWPDELRPSRIECFTLNFPISEDGINLQVPMTWPRHAS